MEINGRKYLCVVQLLALEIMKTTEISEDIENPIIDELALFHTT